MSNFDVVAHHRRRTRTAEGRADGLARELAKADRLLALALRVAAGDECDPLVLLRVLKQVDERVPGTEVHNGVTHFGPTIDDLVVLFRQTDPGRRAA